MKKADDKRVEYFRAHFLDLLGKAETQKWVAAESGLQQSTISHIKHRARNTTEDTMAKIAKAFGLDLEEFIEIGKRKFHEKEMATYEPSAFYGPQRGCHSTCVEFLKRSEATFEEFPKLPKYLEAFQTAMEIGNKRLMLATIEEIRDYLRGEGEE